MLYLYLADWSSFFRLCKMAPKSDIIVLVATFFLTVFFDLVVAIEIGVVLAALLFMKRMAETADIKAWKYTDSPDITPGEAEKLRDIPHSISVFEICGPMFFAAADQILNINSNHHTKVVVIRMRSVPAIDASAMRSLHELANRAKRKNITLVFSHVNEQPMRVMEKDGFIGLVGKENFHNNIVDALDYAEALAQATELGYAEADPTADVEGYDAGRKMAIMASIAFNSRVTFPQVYTEGITKISADDIRYAKEFGYVIKLLGLARNTPEGIEVKVHPMLIDENHPLAGVKDAFNAVFVHADAMDDAMFMGRGAGQMPTASAVMGDVVDVMRNLVYNCCGRVGCSCYKQLPVKQIGETKSKFFLRIHAQDKPGVLANIASVLGNNGVSIAQVVQKSRKGGIAELVIITDEVQENNFNDAMTIFSGMSVVKEISGVIRVY